MQLFFFLIGACLMVGCSEEIPIPNPPGNLPAFETDVLVLGEVHGTENAPTFTVETIRALPNRPLAIGFEVPVHLQTALDTFLASDGSESATLAFLNHSFWRGGHDGRSSESFFASLNLIRKLSKEDDGISVFLFDAGVPMRDKKMADEILRHARDTKTVLLTGNVHARTTVGVPWDPSFKPMAWYIAQELSVQSYNVNGADGEAWCCQNRRCGVHRLKGTAPVDRWEFYPYAQPDDAGFSGEFWVGEHVASFPKVPIERVVQ